MGVFINLFFGETIVPDVWKAVFFMIDNSQLHQLFSPENRSVINEQVLFHRLAKFSIPLRKSFSLQEADLKQQETNGTGYDSASGDSGDGCGS